MRFLIALLIGLLAGALLTSMLMRSLAAGSAYPKGVMAVQAAHFSALNTLAKDNRCSAAEIQKDLLPMRILAADIEDGILPARAGDLLAGELLAVELEQLVAGRLGQVLRHALIFRVFEEAQFDLLDVLANLQRRS